MRFDDVLEHHVGEFGPYQKRIYFLTCLCAVAAAYSSLNPVFIFADTKHRCQLPGIDNDTYAPQSDFHSYLINISIPIEKDYYGKPMSSQCNIFDFGNVSLNGLLDTNPNMTKRACDKWVFDESHHVTAINEYEMVCDDEILQSHYIMVTFIGGLMGSFINGILADKFGRKRIFLICLGIYLVATVIQIAAPIYSLFLAMRFIQGISGIGIFMISFVYVMELVGPNKRMFAGIFIEIFWCVGLFILVALAYVIKQWKHLMIALFTPCILFFSYIFILPESPRWLMSAGRVNEAEKILQKAARVNGTTLPTSLLEKVAEEEKKAQEGKNEAGQVWKLFTHKTLLFRFLIIVMNRFALNMSYYGISLNVSYLSGNLYLNYTLSSAVETLACIVILLLISRLGRKPLYCVSMILAALGFLTSTLPIFFGDENDNMWAVGLVMVGKFGCSAAFDVMYVYGCEVFPTSLRNSALGLSLFIEILGGVVSPYIINIGTMIGDRLGAAFPMLVFGTVSLVAGLVSLLLPETKNQQLPETIEDAIKFGKVSVPI